MTQQKTPREALDRFIDIPATRAPSKIWLNQDYIDAILTALAPYLRTPGTFEVCELCGRAASLLNKLGCGKLYDIHGERECPIKQVMNEKA